MIHTVFAGAHPDDELLGKGVALAEHAAAGQDVHVLWLTRGTGSGVINQLNGLSTSTWWGVTHNPGAEGYQPLSPADLGAARIAEATTAMRCLAAGQPGTITVHEAGLLDGAVTEADAYDAIFALCDEIAPNSPVRIKTHSHVVDDHPDHLAIGAAARQLAADFPTLYADLRHYILPPYWSDPRLSQVAEAWDNPTNDDIRRRVRNAIRAYGAWHPPHSFAVGYHSVPAMFDQLAANPRCMVHP